MIERLLVGMTGYSGTGKSTISKHLADTYGFYVQEGSVLIRQVASERGQTLTSRVDYEETFRATQKSRGMTWLSESLLASSGERLLHAGLRAKCDLKNIKQAGGMIIALICPEELCVERIDSSNPKNPTTIEEYRQHQALENNPDENGYGAHTSWCIDNADYRIYTSGPLEVAVAEIGALLGR